MSTLNTTRFAGLTILAIIAVGCTTTAPRVAQVETQASQAQVTPQEAFDRLVDGNQRFVADQNLNRDYSAQVAASATGQYPFASIVACLDSRTSAERMFDLGIGDAFCARVAGNFINDDILGSLEFASHVAGSRLIAVIGHNHCGAVKAACDNVQLGNVTSVVQQIRPAVDLVPNDASPRNSKNPAFVDKVAHANVELALAEILEKSPILREMVEQGRLGLVGGMYDLTTGQVTFLPATARNVGL